MTSKEEQETTVCAGRAEDTVAIYTTNTTHLRKLRANPRVVETGGGEDWGAFLVPNAIFDPLTGFKREKRQLTEEQKQAARDKMAKVRQARNG